MRMKPLFSFAVVLVLAVGCGRSTSVQTPVKSADVAAVSIRLPTLKCKTCVKTLTTALGSVDGIESAEFDLEGKKATVKFITARMDVGKIRTTISNAGYDADDVKRDSSAYQDLPECCK